MDSKDEEKQLKSLSSQYELISKVLNNWDKLDPLMLKDKKENETLEEYCYRTRYN